MTPRTKFSFSIEIFILGWKFHSRLKISIPDPVLLRPERGPEWKKHSRLKISFRIESLIFSILPLEIDFFNPGALWDCQVNFGNGANTVSESTVSNTEPSEFFGPHRVPGGKLSEFLSAYYLCVPKRTHRVFRRTHRVCPRTQWGSVSSLLRNSTLETVFRPL